VYRKHVQRTRKHSTYIYILYSYTLDSLCPRDSVSPVHRVGWTIAGRWTSPLPTRETFVEMAYSRFFRVVGHVFLLSKNLDWFIDYRVAGIFGSCRDQRSLFNQFLQMSLCRPLVHGKNISALPGRNLTVVFKPFTQHHTAGINLLRFRS